MMLAARYARENNVPYLGICLGMQIATMEIARNVLKLDDANSTEFDQQTKNPIFDFITGIDRNNLDALNITVPVALHLDHGQSVEVAKKCIEAGYSSVMFDGSHFPYDQNLAMTKELIEFANAHEVSVKLKLDQLVEKKMELLETGFLKTKLKKAISLGISKINVNTELQLAFRDATREYVLAGKDLDDATKGFDQENY
ncbi:hypothetical protein FQA39_LY13002 [Lamprigera yunnana]|nr:hypothetical protein FQA39_LY13002 [Lamprigera yunnana]